MLQKFKITICAFIFCLFGLTLMTVTPVLAMDSEFARCDNIGSGEVTQQILKKMLRCFKQLLNSDDRELEGYQRCQSLEKGPSERDSWPRRKLECFRALVSSISRHPNPESQPQYEMSYKHNCVFNQGHEGENMFANQQPFLEGKARCDAAKKAACQGKKGKKKAKCKKTWEAGLRAFMEQLEDFSTPRVVRIQKCIDGGGFIETDGTCCSRPRAESRGGGCTPGTNFDQMRANQP